MPSLTCAPGPSRTKWRSIIAGLRERNELWKYTARRAFSTAAASTSRPKTCTSQFQKNWPLSWMTMARVCTSSPVEQPAERTRSERSPEAALRSFRALRMGSAKTWSWGASRKK